MILKSPENNPQTKGGSIDLKHKIIDAGVLGKFFGMGDHAARNVTGLVIIVLIIIIGVSFFLYSGDVKVIEFIKMISPIITLGLGYLFGKNSDN